jgi:hypothetical protein
VFCQSADLQLNCPALGDWCYTQTLSCVVSISSTASCPSGSNTTYFKRNGNNVCVVDNADYASCNYNSTTATKECGCQKNGTHYTFLYRIPSGGVAQGSWDCETSCGLINPLVKDIAPTCSGSTNTRECHRKNISFYFNLFYV